MDNFAPTQPPQGGNSTAPAFVCDQPTAEQLNRDCFCHTCNRQQLNTLLKTAFDGNDRLASTAQLFTDSTVYISAQQLAKMRDIIDAIERVVALPAYIAQINQHAPPVAAFKTGTAGVFMGYDFHLSADGPKLIEINSNAGGAFLNNALQQAQNPCPHAKNALAIHSSKIGYSKIDSPKTFDETIWAMFKQEWFKQEWFKQEWQLQRSGQALTCIAIVDEQPAQQFLYGEFKLAQQLFERQGLHTVIVDANHLTFTHGQLRYNDQKIDLVYNRLTDFYFTQPHSYALQQAYLAGAVVVTPNPHHHACYADKRRLIVLGDARALTALGATAADALTLSGGIPPTQIVSSDNAALLWKDRKQLFFKPAIGYGSRAAYRGDKLTQRVWQDIQQQAFQQQTFQQSAFQQSAYVAQQHIAPSERWLMMNDTLTPLKVDIRAYTYAGNIQLLAARLYQGQTTNFRTPGGGFAAVVVVG